MAGKKKYFRKKRKTYRRRKHYKKKKMGISGSQNGFPNFMKTKLVAFTEDAETAA